jgi:hypothetical protein
LSIIKFYRGLGIAGGCPAYGLTGAAALEDQENSQTGQHDATADQHHGAGGLINTPPNP